MNPNEVKRCPFCGGEAEIARKGTARQSMLISCTNCNCHLESGDVYGLTKPENYAWNRRTTVSIETAKEMAEALEFVSKFDELGAVSEGLVKDALAAFNREKGGQG